MRKSEYLEKAQIKTKQHINNILNLIKNLNYKIENLEKSKLITDNIIEKFDIQCFNYNLVEEMKLSRDKLKKEFENIVKQVEIYLVNDFYQEEDYIIKFNSINDLLYNYEVQINSITKDDFSNIEKLQMNAIKKGIFDKYMLIKADIDRDKIKIKFDKLQNRSAIGKAFDKFFFREDIIEGKKDNLFVAIKGIDDFKSNIIQTEEPSKEYKIIDILADIEIFITDNKSYKKYRNQVKEIIKIKNEINNTFSIQKSDLKKAINEKYNSRLPMVISKNMTKLRKERYKILAFLNRSGYSEQKQDIFYESKMSLIIKKLNILSKNMETQIYKDKIG